MLQFKVTVLGFNFILCWFIEKVYCIVKIILFLFFKNKRPILKYEEKISFHFILNSLYRVELQKSDLQTALLIYKN